MMQYKNMKIALLVALLVAVPVLYSSLLPSPVFADHGKTAAECGNLPADEQPECLEHAEDDPGGLGTAGSGNCDEDEVEIGVAVPGSEDRCIENGDADDNPIFVYLRGIIQFLATGVGIIVTINLVIGGIQYMASRGNPQATQAALSRITNSVIALVLFILMAAILNFLVPGGLL